MWEEGMDGGEGVRKYISMCSGSRAPGDSTRPRLYSPPPSDDS